MKKLVCIICSICLFMFPMSVYAMESKLNTAITVEISELEYFQELRSRSDAELKKEGMSQEEIDYIRNFNLVEAIKERANLPEEELKGMGHTDDEIVRMKQLLDRKKITEDEIVKEVRGSTLTLTVMSPTCSSSHFYYQYSFRWSYRPFFLYDDLLAVTWAAVNSSGQYTAVAINKNFSDLTVKYTNEDTIFPMTDKKYKWDIVNEYSAAKIKFDMGIYESNLKSWVYYGSGSLVFDAVVSSSIYEFYLRVGYGHSVISSTPSVTFSGTGFSVNFEFGITTQEEAIYSRRCRYDGQYQS